MEEKNDYALVPVAQDPDLKKKRNDSLKTRARLVSGRAENKPNPYTFGKEDTFLTGGGLPGQKREEVRDENQIILDE